MPAYFAWLAIAVFLFAGASIHSHTLGWHGAQQCTICALEDISMQGASLTAVPITVVPIQIVVPVLLAAILVHTRLSAKPPIRAPPVFS